MFSYQLFLTYVITPFATGLIIESFFVQLSRYSQVSDLSFASLAFARSAILLPNPENDTDFKSRSRIQQFPFDAVRPCQPTLRCLTCSLSFAISGWLPLTVDFRRRHRPWNELPRFRFRFLPRKEVIQPHLPIRLPCYDFTPVIGLALDGWLLAVTSPALGTPNSHGVTGGVYKARERIHRGMLIRDY